jgi:hypothetical protein
MELGIQLHALGNLTPVKEHVVPNKNVAKQLQED